LKEKIVRDKRIDGDVIFDGKIVFKDDCVVNGSIQAENIIAEKSIDAILFIKARDHFIAGGCIGARGYISAGKSIKAYGAIEVNEFIETHGSLEAGDYIEVPKGFITARGEIRAGGYIRTAGFIESQKSIEAGEYIFSFEFQVSAYSIKTKTLPFKRNYWPKMPPFKKWRERILSDDQRWHDFREKITEEEAREICSWDGWHWLLRAHLEMFFGLKDEYILSPEEKIII